MSEVITNTYANRRCFRVEFETLCEASVAPCVIGRAGESATTAAATTTSTCPAIAKDAVGVANSITALTVTL